MSTSSNTKFAKTDFLMHIFFSRPRRYNCLVPISSASRINISEGSSRATISSSSTHLLPILMDISWCTLVYNEIYIPYINTMPKCNCGFNTNNTIFFHKNSFSFYFWQCTVKHDTQTVLYNLYIVIKIILF